MSLFLGVAAGAAIAAPSPSSGASDIVPVIPDPLSGKEEQVTKLPNGLSVLILKDTRFPLVSTRLYVHAGSSYETPDQAGISHVLEHMVHGQPPQKRHQPGSGIRGRLSERGHEL